MERVEIYQDGVLIGTIPRPDIAPKKVFTFLMDRANQMGDPMATMRTTDFITRWKATDGGWREELVLEADGALGLGDFENIRGFIRASA